MKNHVFRYIIALAIFFAIFHSCSTPEPDLTKQVAQETIPDSRYFGWLDSIEQIAYRTSSWKPVDTFYRTNISGRSNRDLVNSAIFFMSITPDSFMVTAPAEVLSFYLHEAEGIDFNINLRLLVPMLERATPELGKRRTAEMASKFYEKNMAYWNSHFPGKTIYLEKNAVALEKLKNWRNER